MTELVEEERWRLAIIMSLSSSSLCNPATKSSRLALLDDSNSSFCLDSSNCFLNSCIFALLLFFPPEPPESSCTLLTALGVDVAGAPLANELLVFLLCRILANLDA